MLFLILRIAIFFVILAAFGVGLSWFNSMSGDVVIGFAGQDYIMSPLILIGAVLVVVFGFALVVTLIRLIIGGPNAISGYFRKRSQAKGLQAVLRSMQYLATGETGAAAREAQDAHKLLQNADFTLLLTAQTAQANKQKDIAHDAFLKLSQNPKTALVGLKGLAEEAKEQGDIPQALVYTNRAYDLDVRNPWALKALFDLHIQQENWRDALKVLTSIRRAHLFTRNQTDHFEAVLRLAQAQEYIAKGEAESGLVDAVKALKLAPTFVPAAVTASRLLVADEKPRKAQRLLQETWARIQHPDLVQVYRDLYPEEKVEERNKRFGKLFLIAPDNLETKLASIELDLLNENFPGARDKLKPLLDEKPTARMCALQAAILRGLGENEAVVRAWLSRALKSPRGMQWQCKDCASISENWSPVCPSCDAFDAIHWTYIEDAAISHADVLTPLVETDPPHVLK
jgi:HemY protein